MVLCLIALPVFLVLGIFSIKYRKLAKDALHCLTRTVMLRKCESGLDDRIRSSITGKVLRFSPRAARLVYRHYKLLSWIMLALFIWSGYVSAVGIYNYVLYGNCNGPESTGFCLLDPTGSQTKTSGVEIDLQGQLIQPKLQDDDPIIGSKNATITIIEFGCYTCSYTKKAEETLKEVLKEFEGKVNLQYKTFIIPSHNLSYDAAVAANCAAEQGKYEAYHEGIFANQEKLSKTALRNIAYDVGLDITKFEACTATDKYRLEINDDTLMGVHAGVVGTPTFFINGRKIVGPKPFRTFKTVIEEVEKCSN